MRVYSVKFKGVWPVGACAIVVANDIQEAMQLFKKSLEDRGLLDDNNDLWCDPKEYVLVDTDTPNSMIVLDGEY